MSKVASLCVETNKPILVDKNVKSIEGEQYPYHNKLVSIYDFTGVMNWYIFWRGINYYVPILAPT